MSGLSINYNENRDAWDAFVSTSPQRSIFAYSNFLDSLLVKYELVTCYEKENIVAGAIIIYSNSGRPIDTPFPFTQYQGLFLADNSALATHSRITRELKTVTEFITQLSNHFGNYCLCHSWRLSDLRPLGFGNRVLEDFEFRI